jgi:hypothetical protein
MATYTGDPIITVPKSEWDPARRHLLLIDPEIG